MEESTLLFKLVICEGSLILAGQNEKLRRNVIQIRGYRGNRGPAG